MRKVCERNIAIESAELGIEIPVLILTHDANAFFGTGSENPGIVWSCLYVLPFAHCCLLKETAGIVRDIGGMEPNDPSSYGLRRSLNLCRQFQNTVTLIATLRPIFVLHLHDLEQLSTRIAGGVSNAGSDTT